MYPPIYNERLIFQRPIPIVDVVQENAVIIEADDKDDDLMGAACGINVIAEPIEPNINEFDIDAHAENANAENEGEFDEEVDNETVNLVKTEKVIYSSALEELEQFLNDEDLLVDPNEATDDPPNEAAQSVDTSAPAHENIPRVIESIIVNNIPTIGSNDDNIDSDASRNQEEHVFFESSSTAEEIVSNEFEKVEESLSDEDSLIEPNETTGSQNELSDDDEWYSNETTDSQNEFSDGIGCDPKDVEAVTTSVSAQDSISSEGESTIVSNMMTSSSNDDSNDCDAPPDEEEHVLFESSSTAEENVSNVRDVTNNMPRVGSNDANIDIPLNVEAAVLRGAVGIETVVNIDDEITMTFTGTQIGRPIQSVSIPPDFIKREADRISGEIPYKEDKVRIFIQ